MGFLSKRVYADAAGATPLSSAARKELGRLLDVYGNAGGLHSEAVAAKEVMENSRKAIAEAIGAHADEIIFTASGTESNNLALAGIFLTFYWLLYRKMWGSALLYFFLPYPSCL